MLTNVISQGNNNRRGLDCEKVDSYNRYTKNVVVVNNLLCLHCGQDGLMKECPARKIYISRKFSKYSKQRNRYKKGTSKQKNT